MHNFKYKFNIINNNFRIIINNFGGVDLNVQLKGNNLKITTYKFNINSINMFKSFIKHNIFFHKDFFKMV